MLSAVAEFYKIESELVPAIATGLCAGLARTGNVCGAVSGAVLSINLIKGRKSGKESIDDCYSLVRSLLKEFEATFGSINCARLTGCDLGTPEGQAYFRENNLIVQCRRFTLEATGMALKILEKA